MHEKQIHNLDTLSAQERYEYFVRYCAGFEEIWGLVVGDDSWVVFKDRAGDEIFPVWPHSDLANAFCFEEHKTMGAKPQSITLDSFINNCVPDMIDHKVYFGVFFNSNKNGLAVEGGQLRDDLQNEVKAVWL